LGEPLGGGGGSACPVDHSARTAWLEGTRSDPAKPHGTPTITTTATCDSTAMDPSSPLLTSGLPPVLSPHRQVSSIPRAPSGDGSSSSSSSNNSETVDAHTSPSGHWIYPSEQMFFRAMQRKNWTPSANDMSTLVPIHNAVNERAWAEITAWERGRGGEACGGPKLVSFSGDSARLTPKARLMVLLGYQRPFDRHDWTVNRCGKRVDYVIDFYSGRADPACPHALSVYIDARPKLNSVEGVNMRLQRFWQSWFPLAPAGS